MFRTIDKLRLRLASLFRAGKVERSLKQEIEVHLQEQIDENLAAGMPPGEARAAALRAFGPLSVIEEQCRDTRRVAFVEHLALDLRYTLRTLVHQPMLLAAAVLSIGVAIAANTTIFNLASQLLFATPSAHRPDRLVHIWIGGGSHVSHRQWRALEERRALDGLTGFNIETSANWRGPERTINLISMAVAGNFFDVVGVPMALGRGFTAREAQAELDPAVVVISHRFWQQRLGGSPTVVGSTLIFNARPYTVTGVIAEGVRSIAGLGLSPEVYLPVGRTLMPDFDGTGPVATIQLVGRLRDDQTLAAGRAALAAAGQAVAVPGQRRLGEIARFVPVGSTEQFGDLTAVSAFFGVLLVAAGLILAIACANVAGLMLARATVRSREIAVRVALGASRWRLVQQLLVEGFWIAFFGTVTGLVLMDLIISLLARVPLPLPLPLELHADFDHRVLAYSTLLTLLTTVLCALVPALQATRRSQLPALKNQDPIAVRGIGRRFSLRNLLVVGQVAVALVLLVTALLFVRNLTRAADLDPGFAVEDMLVAQIGIVQGKFTPATGTAWLDAAVERVRALPGVAGASYAFGAPLALRSGMTTGARLVANGKEPGFQATYQDSFVGPDYFRVMGIGLVKGREFRQDDRRGGPVVVAVNEEFVRRYLADVEPIGAELRLPGPTEAGYLAEVVAVVRNGKYRSLGESQQAAVYEVYGQRVNQHRFAHIFVRARAGAGPSPRDIAPLLQELDPSASIDVQPMRTVLAFAFLPSRVGAGLLGALGGLGLTLAMVGLFAIVAYSVSRRSSEIGIRVALGATRAAVMTLVIREALIIACLGCALGLAAAWLITSPLAMFLVAGLTPTDPTTFIGTTALMLGVSVLAAWLPARRALRIDPVTALRAE
jgi:putative ABC transport system permease protein